MTRRLDHLTTPTAAPTARRMNRIAILATALALGAALAAPHAAAAASPDGPTVTGEMFDAVAPASASSDASGLSSLGQNLQAGAAGAAPTDIFGSSVWPTRAWTADSRGYGRQVFQPYERILFFFSAYNSGRYAQTAQVTIRASRNNMCIMIYPMPPGCGLEVQTLFNGYSSFRPGASTKYLPATSDARDRGEWTYEVVINGDLRGAAESRFSIR